MALKPACLQWSDDGSVSSTDFDDIYFQPGQGLEESDYVFLQGNDLANRFKKTKARFHIAELGFGSGLNFLATAALFLKKAPKKARLFYAAIEKHPITRPDLEKIHTLWPKMGALATELQHQYPPLIEGFHTLWLAKGRIQLLLAFGDVAETLPQMTGKFDAWYLDGFAPQKNPEMWQDSLYPHIAAKTAPGGTVATFSAASNLSRNLEAAGFLVEKREGFGKKREMTLARKEGTAPTARTKKTIAVLGAGIAGCAAAAALARRGYAVTILDRQNTSAQETSGNPVAILYPKVTVDEMPLGAFHQHAFCHARGLLRSLKLPSWHETGVLHLDTDDETQKRHEALGGADSRFTPDFATYSEGNGLFHAGAGHLSPPELCRELIRNPAIKKKFTNHVWRLERENNKWCAYGEEDDALLAEVDILVIALGYDSAAFDATDWLPLQALRGQITFLREKPCSRPMPHIVCHDGYMTPAIGGLHFIGATFQKEMPDATDLRDRDDFQNLQKLEEHLPEAGFTPEDIVGGRAGYRTTTPDRLPLIGPCPDYKKALEVFADLRQGKETEDVEMPYIDNLYLTTGYGAHGMSGAPFAGEIIAAMIAGDPLPLPKDLLDYVLPERFIKRYLKRNKI